MRVLHLDAGREMRGGQWQVVRLIEGLAQRGVESRLLARAASPLLAEARCRGWSAGALSLARVAIESRRCDLVHAHDSRSHTLAAIAGGAPLVVARRVAFIPRSGWKYRRAARFIAVSGFVAGVLKEAGVAPDRIAVVYDGVPLLEPDALKSGVVAPANAADPRKGAAVAARAAELAGAPIAFSDDLERDLPSAAVFVYVSYSEGLGSGALLAMSAGAAVVASRTGGLPEAVEDGVTGLLVESSPQAVGGAIRRLLEAPELARAMGERGRRRVAERFKVDDMVEGTLAVYRQLAK